ncbi:hypothetical protein Aple_033550 [Acrocarpospora pleiomorpha]|uniref:Uncharacterized protein n=1 Tax=Acrocarpospora pleiomorpha TaxID=90975 RepID=A0A5M3XK00_9ACTN|nr:hypothetical protein Aple_033550 [Acrocarpospora pleiomorpha]
MGAELRLTGRRRGTVGERFTGDPPAQFARVLGQLPSAGRPPDQGIEQADGDRVRLRRPRHQQRLPHAGRFAVRDEVARRHSGSGYDGDNRQRFVGFVENYGNSAGVLVHLDGGRRFRIARQVVDDTGDHDSRRLSSGGPQIDGDLLRYGGSAFPGHRLRAIDSFRYDRNSGQQSDNRADRDNPNASLDVYARPLSRNGNELAGIGSKSGQPRPDIALIYGLETQLSFGLFRRLLRFPLPPHVPLFRWRDDRPISSDKAEANVTN